MIDFGVNMIIEMCEQRSQEWHAMKLGTISASSCEDISTAARRKTYVNKLLAQILSGSTEPFFMTDAVQRGIDYEQLACEDYEKANNVKVEHVGIIFEDERRIVACSPDALVGENGLVEFKCPNTSTHIGYWLDGIPSKYMAQVQFQMMVTGRKWCDFVSWDDRVRDEKLVMYQQRVYRDEEMIRKLRANIDAVIKDVNKFLTEHGLEWQRW